MDGEGDFPERPVHEGERSGLVAFMIFSHFFLQEIDRVIEKLEFEMKKARDDSEKSTEARIGRLKAKHETEIGENIIFYNNIIILIIYFIRRTGKRD